MHHFTYKEQQLYCEDVPIFKIADDVGTPFYLYSCATLRRHYQAFYTAFEGVNTLVCYSAKANTNLAVLKLFGQQDNLISFPMEGYTLALDFPIRRGLFSLLSELDRLVEDYGGRLYLAKDARMTPQMFTAGYPQVPAD